MLKRQESVMTYQNHRESQSIGCMAGIFHLLSKYHSRRRFLTTGKRNLEPNDALIESPRIFEQGKKQETKQKNNSSSKRKCRTNLKEKNNTIRKTTEPDTERRPSLVEKVISPSAVGPEVEAEVKRRKLVVALEKCDEDLKAINTIIDTLRSNNQKLSSSCFKPSEAINNGHVTRYGEMVQQTKPQPRKDFFEKVISQVLSAHTAKIPLWRNKAKIESVDEVCSDLVWGIDRELGKIRLVLEDYIFRCLIDEFVNEFKSDSAYDSLPKLYHAILRPCNAELPLVLPPLPLEACKRRLSF